MKLTDVIRRPLITEKTSILREDGRTIVFQVAPDANKIEIKRAVEQLLGAKVASIRTSIAHGKIKRQGRFAGRRSGLEEGVREAARRREAARVPGRRVSVMPIRKYNPTSPGQRFQTVQTFDEITTTRAAQAAGRAAAQLRRPQQPGRADVVVARRRPQADVPHHRLQARQARHSGEGVDDRVRPEPVGAHRAADLRRRREALHPAAGRAEGRRHDRRRRRTSTSCRATACR